MSLDSKLPEHRPGMAVVPSRPHPVNGKAFRILLLLALVAFAIIHICGRLDRSKSVEQQLPSSNPDKSFEWEDVSKCIRLGRNVLIYAIRLPPPNNSYTIHALTITNALACRFQ